MFRVLVVSSLLVASLSSGSGLRGQGEACDGESARTVIIRGGDALWAAWFYPIDDQGGCVVPAYGAIVGCDGLLEIPGGTPRVLLESLSFRLILEVGSLPGAWTIVDLGACTQAHGRLVDSAGGVMKPGTRVEAVWRVGESGEVTVSTHTDEEGAFQFPHFPVHEDVVLRVKSLGRFPLERELRTTKPRAIQQYLGEFDLAGSAVVRGTVTTRDGRPISNALVGIRPVGENEVPSLLTFRTNEGGNFLFGNVPSGAHEVVASEGKKYGAWLDTRGPWYRCGVFETISVAGKDVTVCLQLPERHTHRLVAQGVTEGCVSLNVCVTLAPGRTVRFIERWDLSTPLELDGLYGERFAFIVWDPPLRGMIRADSLEELPAEITISATSTLRLVLPRDAQAEQGQGSLRIGGEIESDRKVTFEGGATELRVFPETDYDVELLLPDGRTFNGAGRVGPDETVEVRLEPR